MRKHSRMKFKFSPQGFELDIPAAGRVIAGAAGLVLAYNLPAIITALRWW